MLIYFFFLFLHLHFPLFYSILSSPDLRQRSNPLLPSSFFIIIFSSFLSLRSFFSFSIDNTKNFITLPPLELIAPPTSQLRPPPLTFTPSPHHGPIHTLHGIIAPYNAAAVYTTASTSLYHLQIWPLDLLFSFPNRLLLFIIFLFIFGNFMYNFFKGTVMNTIDNFNNNLSFIIYIL